MMPLDVDAIANELRQMTITRLRERYAEVFGEATRSFNRQHLVKRVAWRLQAMQEGDLSERARRAARELANDADLRVRPPSGMTVERGPGATTTLPFRVAPDDRLPPPGTLLKRQYRGKTIHVRVLPKGFEYDGEVYRSLSAVARRITGAHWNGFHFFGLPRPGQEPAA